MQCTIAIFHFEEQLFTAVFSTEQVHYLLGVCDKVKELSWWNIKFL